MARVAIAAPGPRRAFNLDHVAALFAVRWKLTLRGYRRRKVISTIGVILALLLVVGVIGEMSAVSYVGYVRLPHGLAVQVLFIVLAGLYIGWITLPLLQYTLNEGLDVTKLAILPVTRAERMVALLLATLLDVGTLALVAFFIPILLAWAHTPAGLAIIGLALALAYLHTVAMSQLVLAAMVGLLRNRRWRDLSIVFFALLGVSCAFVGQFANRFFEHVDFRRGVAQFEGIHLDQYLQFTPPGMAARAIELASRGQYLPALEWSAALLVLAPPLIVVWSWVLDRGVTAAESGGGSGATTRPARRRGAAPSAAAETATTARRRGPIPDAVLAIAQKDARYLWRDPQLKANLLSSLFILVLVVLPNFGVGQGGGFGLQPQRVLFTPLPTLAIVFNLALNALGMERAGLQLLYLFPVRPLHVFWGKNLAVGAVTFGAQVVLAVALAAITGGWFYVVPTLVGGLAAILVLLGFGNVTSVLLPFHMRDLQTGRTSLAADNGCLRSVISLLTLAAAGVVLLPVIGAVGLPIQYDTRVLLFLTLPAALLYGIVVHQAATRFIAPRLLTRGPEILAVTVRE
jgi:ABC-type multidrug transport system fused ATPase/permease subunit